MFMINHEIHKKQHKLVISNNINAKMVKQNTFLLIKRTVIHRRQKYEKTNETERVDLKLSFKNLNYRYLNDCTSTSLSN